MNEREALIKAFSPPSGEKRAWQRMLSGRRLDLLNPNPADVEIEDIAHGLARVARWNGQTVGEHAFSVAEHSLFVVDVLLHLNPNAPKEWQLAALLHDAPEYVIGDLISPFKAAIGMDYKVFELKLLAAIHQRFGLVDGVEESLNRAIKQADTIAAYFEAVQLAGFSEDEARALFMSSSVDADQLNGFDVQLVPVSVAEAQRAFLERFRVLS